MKTIYTLPPIIALIAIGFILGYLYRGIQPQPELAFELVYPGDDPNMVWPAQAYLMGIGLYRGPFDSEAGILTMTAQVRYLDGFIKGVKHKTL